MPNDYVSDELARLRLHDDTEVLRSSIGQALLGALRDAVPGSERCLVAEVALNDLPPDEWDAVLRQVIERLSGGNW